MAGGTFTLTNTGSRGALFDTPIVFLPQSAILGTGIVTKKPVVVSDAGGDAIAIRSMVYLALSYDHRIVDGADAAQQLRIDVHPRATLVGWDIVQLGRVAAGECWQRGYWRQRLQLIRDGRERWREVADLAASDPLRDSPLGLASMPIMATAWATAPALVDDQETLLQALRECAASFPIACGISWLPAPTGLLLIRALGTSSELARALLEALWDTLRPIVIGRGAHRPRIWDT